MKSKSGSKSGKILFPSNLRENGCERFKDTFFVIICLLIPIHNCQQLLVKIAHKLQIHQYSAYLFVIMLSKSYRNIVILNTGFIELCY